MTLTLELPESVATRLRLLPAEEVSPFAIAAIAEGLSLPQEDEVTSVRRALEQVKSGQMRSAAQFFAQHREHFPEPRAN